MSVTKALQWCDSAGKVRRDDSFRSRIAILTNLLRGLVRPSVISLLLGRREEVPEPVQLLTVVGAPGGQGFSQLSVPVCCTGPETLKRFTKIPIRSFGLISLARGSRSLRPGRRTSSGFELSEFV